LRALAARLDVVAVVTQPPRPSGRGQRLQQTPVALAAAELNVTVIAPERVRDALEPLRDLAPDLFAVASYGKILPQALLDIPPRGAFNVHPSVLPLYRGATPLQAQIRDRCSESGVTIIAMDAGMDTGDILAQRRTPLGERETYGELEARLAQLGAEVLLEAIAREEAGTLTRAPQQGLASDAEIAATLTRPLSSADLQVDWKQSAARVDAFVRSLAPLPAARGEIGGTPCKIIAVHPVVPDDGRAPGTTLRIGRNIAVACAEGAVAIDKLIPANRKLMSGEAFAASL
jgi:methionyl-tRNA formyltransferase